MWSNLCNSGGEIKVIGVFFKEPPAAIYSMLGTAELNGVDSEQWLRAEHPFSRIVLD
jgi:hypothetical protein